MIPSWVETAILTILIITNLAHAKKHNIPAGQSTCIIRYQPMKSNPKSNEPESNSWNTYDLFRAVGIYK